MVKFLTPLAAAAVAAAGLALAGPVTGHAQGCGTGGCGPCAFSSPNHPVQSEDIGSGNKHSFTKSHNNCVLFQGNDNTVLLNHSDGNGFLVLGSFNKVDDFTHSNDNVVEFSSDSTGNHLQASQSNDTFIDFNAATSDFVDLIGASNDDITVTGTGLFADVFGSNGSCAVNATTAAGGTARNPAIIVC